MEEIRNLKWFKELEKGLSYMFFAMAEVEGRLMGMKIFRNLMAKSNPDASPPTHRQKVEGGACEGRVENPVRVGGS
jgi:hypothetical protein